MKDRILCKQSNGPFGDHEPDEKSRLMWCCLRSYVSNNLYKMKVMQEP